MSSVNGAGINKNVADFSIATNERCLSTSIDICKMYLFLVFDFALRVVKLIREI